jgi:acyl-CoA synthetase (AMP-forming)/AMP-acid ligase II
VDAAVSWRTRILRDAPIDGQEQTMWSVVEERAARTPDELCLVDERDRSLTFAGYRNRAQGLAAALADGHGIGPGSVVAWQLPTTIEAVVVLGALARLGVTQVPLLPISGDRELRHILGTTRPGLLIVPTSFRGRPYAEESVAYVEAFGLELLVLDEDLPSADPGSLPLAPTDAVEGRWVYFTSGTTGVPKGARHSDESLLWAAHAEVDCLQTGTDDRTTIVFPIAHIGGSFFFMAGLVGGHGQILVSVFDESSVDVLRRHGVTWAGAGLSFQRAYLEAQRRQPGVPLFERIRGFPHGGDAKRPYVHAALREEFGGVGILSGYGMTEFAMISSGAADDPAEKLLDRIGRPCAGIDVRIVGPDERVCPSMEQGEIRAKGRSMMLGYLDPAQDEQAFDADGYFRTGDVGFLDDDGFLELTGRLKDVIIRKGETISAVEVEDLLQAHPSVSEVSVVGVPDDDRGEMCCAVVVLVPGAEPVDLAEVTRFLLGAGLTKQKLPERVEQRDELPRDFFAKVNKAQLRKELADGA